MLNIHPYTGGPLATNAFFASAPDAPAGVLIDAPAGAAEWIAERGFRVAALLLTHQHFDHIQDAAAVVRAHGCPVIAWCAFDRSLTLEDEFGGFAGLSLEIEPIDITRTLEGAPELLAVETAGLSFRVLHVPGHSTDSICFHDPAAGVIFDGDVLMRGSIGRFDFPGGDGALLARGIAEKIYPLPSPTRVFPGHGAETTVGEERRSNPFVQG